MKNQCSRSIRVQIAAQKAATLALVLGMACSITLAKGTPLKTEEALPSPLYCPRALATTDAQIQRILNWRPDPNPANLCRGTFYESPEFNSLPLPLRASALQVTAAGPVTLRDVGESVLQKKVILLQPHRKLEADEVHLRRNGQHQLTEIQLVGHVRYQEKNHVLAGASALSNLQTNITTVHDGFYRVYTPTPTGATTVWGQACLLKRLPDHSLALQEATYTTCKPCVHPSWVLHAKKLFINPHTQRGTAQTVWIQFYGVPIFFSPYLSFPTGKQRKSGFLLPTFSYSNRDGFSAGLPFYWNIAPNVDDTLGVKWISKRGVQISNFFRYLTEQGEGVIYGAFLPNDQLFKSFRAQELKNPPTPPPPQPYLDALQGDSNNRYYFSLENRTHLPRAWDLSWIVNRVSDDYYFEDFGTGAPIPHSRITLLDPATTTQLLTQLDVQHKSPHWQFQGLLQTYQTLHPLDQLNTLDQYQKLPQLDLLGSYPDLPGHLDLELNNQFVNFYYFSAYIPDKPQGQRLALQPTLSLPLYYGAAFFKPSIGFSSVSYDVQRQVINQPQQISRNLPIISLDTGLVFQNDFQWGTHSYAQTLKPELFYLYVPFASQEAIPLFDTFWLPFSFNQLFATNAFTGLDRQQNANQITTALSSEIINEETGAPVLNFGMGIITYFAPRNVIFPGTDPKSPIYTSSTSPLAVQLVYFPKPFWSLSWDGAWNMQYKQLDNTNIALNYQPASNRLLSLGYNFVHFGPDGLTPVNFNEFHVAGAWPFKYHWQGIGYYDYNITLHRPESYYAGLQYENCCWAIRAVVSRTNLGYPTTASLFSNTTYYLQFQLKGLGTLSNRNPGGLLLNTLPGYADLFRGKRDDV